ncbi:MAG: GNAT family N-acetyltransferase [Oscillospiraceae bacterium]|nr:GNAT family N-acetyltransferase [Oscillospiraceae bacterium]
MNITFEPGYQRGKDLLPLFLEYGQLLSDRGGEAMRQCLAVQNYDEEIQHLEEKYGQPRGRLFLVRCDGAVAGCIAIRYLEEGICELKRVYLREEYRGCGVGKMMMEKILAEAREAGYRRMRLDTVPYLDAAHGLYVQFGFYEIEKYYFTNPVEEAIYMEKML